MRHLALFFGLVIIGLSVLLIVSAVRTPLPARAMGLPSPARSLSEAEVAVASRLAGRPAAEEICRRGLGSLLNDSDNADMTLRFTEWAADRGICRSPELGFATFRSDPSLHLNVTARQALLDDPASNASYHTLFEGKVRLLVMRGKEVWIEVSTERMEMEIPGGRGAPVNAERASFTTHEQSTITLPSCGAHLRVAALSLTPDGPTVTLEGPISATLSEQFNAPGALSSLLSAHRERLLSLDCQGDGELDLEKTNNDEHRLTLVSSEAYLLGTRPLGIRGDRATLKWIMAPRPSPKPPPDRPSNDMRTSRGKHSGPRILIETALQEVRIIGDGSPVTYSIARGTGTCREFSWSRAGGQTLFSGDVVLDLDAAAAGSEAASAGEQPRLVSDRLVWQPATDHADATGEASLRIPANLVPTCLASCIEPDADGRGITLKGDSLGFEPFSGTSAGRFDAAGGVTIESPAGTIIGLGSHFVLDVTSTNGEVHGKLNGRPGLPARLTPSRGGLAGDIVEGPVLEFDGSGISISAAGRLHLTLPTSDRQPNANSLEVTGPTTLEPSSDRWLIHDRFGVTLPTASGPCRVEADTGMILDIQGGEPPEGRRLRTRAFIAFGRVVLRQATANGSTPSIKVRHGEMLTALFPPGQILITPRSRGPF